MHNRSPAIQHLAIHLPNQETVVYKVGNALQSLEHAKNTTLTAWFEINAHDPSAREILYHNFPEHFTWDSTVSKWKHRKKGNVIGRLYQVNPTEGERFYLRLLLHHIPGCKSFEDLRTLDNGTICISFKEAALKRGFIQDDQEWIDCLQEATYTATPSQLRSLFITILIFCEPANHLLLWEKFNTHMSEDFLYQAKDIPDHFKKEYVTNLLLYSLDEQLHHHGKSLQNFPGIPQPSHTSTLSCHVQFNLDEQLQLAEKNESLLNKDQIFVYNTIIDAVHGFSKQKTFFVDGPGGSGKTFLYNTILARIRSQRKIAIAVASSGIAAELLAGGRTAHSMFKIPIPIQEMSTCNIGKQTNAAKLIHDASIIIWDEAPMVHKYVLECVNRTLCDIMDCKDPFGGKVILLGGDFRQVLPVIKHGGQADIIESSLKRSFLWSFVKTLHLTINMRVQKRASHINDTFEKFVLDVGNGANQIVENGMSVIKLPEEICLNSNEDGLQKLIHSVYPNLQMFNKQDKTYFGRAILTTTNENVDKINKLVMDELPALPENTRTYLSANSVPDEEQQGLYPIEFLNSLTPSGMPPHRLYLKTNAPVILLRNINPIEGLLNGTRLSVIHLGKRVIEAKIVTGQHSGNSVFLPRITIIPTHSGLPFDLKRRQFPVRPAFAMTINKAQGQTLDYIGLNLSDPVFSHGQLYVALSRVHSFQAVTILLTKRSSSNVPVQYTTENIVYKEVLN